MIAILLLLGLINGSNGAGQQHGNRQQLPSNGGNSINWLIKPNEDTTILWSGSMLTLSFCHSTNSINMDNKLPYEMDIVMEYGNNEHEWYKWRRGQYVDTVEYQMDNVPPYGVYTKQYMMMSPQWSILNNGPILLLDLFLSPINRNANRNTDYMYCFHAYGELPSIIINTRDDEDGDGEDDAMNNNEIRFKIFKDTNYLLDTIRYKIAPISSMYYSSVLDNGYESMGVNE